MSTVRAQLWYQNPYVQLTLTALFITAAEIFLKKGAALSQTGGAATGVLGFDALAWSATWYGIVFHILGFASWLLVLRMMPVVEAFALINLVHVLVPLASALFLNEIISLKQAFGITLVLAGTYLVAATAARAEEKL
jgi:drug/metabolite transporter (DMT)-like permease